MRASRNGITIAVNHRNELVIDMSVKDMAKVFEAHNRRKPRNKEEAATFIQSIIFNRVNKQKMVAGAR